MLNRTRNLVAAVSIAGMLLPPPSAKAETGTRATVASSRQPSDAEHSRGSLYRILDIVLTSNSLAFRGRIMDGEGRGRADVPVALFQNQRRIGSTSTGRDGTFSVSGLRGGVYQVVAGDDLHVVRLWLPNKAPPNAHHRAVFNSDPLMRGQMHPAANMLGNPWVITGLVAAAIIIPVALHNNRSDRRNGS